MQDSVAFERPLVQSSTRRERSKISKACQECRSRKIRCDGTKPCSPCRQRNIFCQFRLVMRRPRKQYNETDQESGGLVPSCKEYVSHSSVTATHQEPLGRGTIELYFGPSSDFALTRNLYREVSSRFNVSEPRSDEKEKEFLDELPIRHIFFGNPSSEEVSLSGGRRRSSSTITPFLQFGLAKSLLDRYLATYYNLAPFVPKRLYQEQLQLMFSSETSQDHDVEQKRVILLAIAIASQSTPHWRWGDTLVQIVENDRRDSVSIENIQLDLLMALYEGEKGQPNPAYAYIGSSARKAFAAGLHKEFRRNLNISDSLLQERRATFWALYFQEIWISFYTGRPSAMRDADSDVPLPDDSFLGSLKRLAEIMTKVTKQVYRPKSQSLSACLHAAISIYGELRALTLDIQKDFGLALEHLTTTDPHGPRETTLVTCYHQIKLLLFRPFVMIRGKLKRDVEIVEPTATPSASTKDPSADSQPHPQRHFWMSEACNHALDAARASIYYFCEIAVLDPLVENLRYNCFFLEHAVYLLMYDILHDEAAGARHLPWVHMSLRFLRRMRDGEPVSSTIDAIRQLLRCMGPNYDLAPIVSPVDESLVATMPSLTPLARSSPGPNPLGAFNRSNTGDAGHVSGQADLWQEALDEGALDLDGEFQSFGWPGLDPAFSHIDMETFSLYMPPSF